MKKKRTPVFLQVYVDQHNKKTFKPGYVELIDAKDKEGKDIKEIKYIPHQKSTNKYGDEHIKPMNRVARRMQAKEDRMYDRKYGPRKEIVSTAPTVEIKKKD